MDLSDETIFLLIGITIFLLILYFRGRYLEKQHIEEVKEELEEFYYGYENLKVLIDVKENIRKFLVSRDFIFLRGLYTSGKITEQMFHYSFLLGKVRNLEDKDEIYKALAMEYHKLKKYGPVEEVFDDLQYLMDHEEGEYLQHLKTASKAKLYKGLNLLDVVHIYFGVEYTMPYCSKCEKIVKQQNLVQLKCVNCGEELYEMPSDIKMKLRFFKPLKWALFGLFAFLFSVILWSSTIFNERDRY